MDGLSFSPESFYTDPGSAFTSAEFSSFLKQRHIGLVNAPRQSHKSVGLVEVTHRILQAVLNKTTTVYADWDLQLPHVTKVLNARYVQSVGFSPIEILYGLSRSTDVGLKSFLTQASSVRDGSFRKSLAWPLEASLDGNSRVRWVGRSEERRARVERKG
ncbi:hypothetical protein E4U44_002609 [Claviceps purpurea]|nr:hypothetical protein E4U44_002609 [Claviceps purpurea]